MPLRFFAYVAFDFRGVVVAAAVLREQPLIPLAPVVLVVAVVVIARLGDAHLEEVRNLNIALAVAKPPPEWPQMPTLSTSMNAILLRELLDPRDLIGNRVVAHVPVVRVVERLRAPRRAHAVDRHDDEAELRERLVVAARR